MEISSVPHMESAYSFCEDNEDNEARLLVLLNHGSASSPTVTIPVSSFPGGQTMFSQHCQIGATQRLPPLWPFLEVQRAF